MNTNTSSNCIASHRIASHRIASHKPCSSSIIWSFMKTFLSLFSGFVFCQGAAFAQTCASKNVFSSTGGDQVYTVPAGVSSIIVKAWGGAGGGNSVGTGGAGGFVSGQISVTPGTQFRVMVGRGGAGDSFDPPSSTYGFGGPAATTAAGGSGGGLSGFFTNGAAAITSTSQSRALFVAGGGGAGDTSGIPGELAHSKGGAGGDTSNSGGVSASMQGQTGIRRNGNHSDGPGAGGGFQGGLAGRTRLATIANFSNGEGGSNFVSLAALNPQLLFTPNPAGFTGAAHNPPNTTDVDYATGIGVGTGGTGGNGRVVVCNIASANLAVSKTNNVSSVPAGSTTTYTIVASNLGSNAANGAVLRDPAATGLSCSAVTCTSAVGTTCAAAIPAASVTIANLQGSGIPISSFPANSTLAFNVTCGVTATGQ
jgi:uncharacterized repeat protein (TIGR01451 family)